MRYEMFTKFDKALAAIIVPFFAGIASHFFGWEVSVETQATLIGALTALFVWLVPNKQ